MHAGSWRDDRKLIEQMLRDGARAGTFVVFEPDVTREAPEIEADFIRHLLLDQLSASCASGTDHGLQGVRIRGARIIGPLNLEDCARSDRCVPPLALEQCDITDEINFEGARLSRLCIKGSRIRTIKLREAEITGHFDFSDCRPFETIPGDLDIAWIDARNALIDGQVTGSGATLQIPPRRNAVDIERDGARFALWLAGAEIRGGVRLLDGFRANGGVSLDGAVVHGHVWCRGARLSAGEDDAFNAQSARIFGNLVLRGKPSPVADGVVADHPQPHDRFRAAGSVWLLGAQISGYLDLQFATIELPPSPANPPKAQAALVLDQADIGASLLLGNTSVSGGYLSFEGARIRGSLVCAGLSIRGVAGESVGFICTSAEIGDSADFAGTVLDGPLDLTGAHVGGALSFDGAKLRCPSANNDGALRAMNIRVAGNVSFNRDGEECFSSEGMIDLTGAKITGDLSFTGSVLNNRSDDGKARALKAERAEIAGSVEFRDGFSADGEIDLGGASIGRDLKCVDARFANSNDAPMYGSAIYAKDLSIGDDVQLVRTEVDGNLRFERIEVTGSVLWYGLSISQRRNDKANAPLDLRHARIGSVLKAVRLTYAAPLSGIDLRGAQASSVESHWPEGWGGAQPCKAGPECTINLDGFAYERLTLSLAEDVRRNTRLRHTCGISTALCAPPQHVRGDALLDWILHQPQHDRSSAVGPPTQATFFPQPYRQLARVLRAQGEEDAARTVTIAEKWAIPMEHSGSGLLRRGLRGTFGFFFGFGFSRTRAAFTLALYVLIGTLGVCLAQHQKMLVENVIVTAQAYTIRYDHMVERVFLKAPAGAELESHVACTDTASNFWTDAVYALDMIVPFIPLHQETKCEISPEPGVTETIWRVLKAVYSIGGWIVFSLCVVTFSGVFKRSDAET